MIRTKAFQGGHSATLEADNWHWTVRTYSETRTGLTTAQAAEILAPAASFPGAGYMLTTALVAGWLRAHASAIAADVTAGQFADVVTDREYVVTRARIGARRLGIDPEGSTSYEIEVGGDDGWGHTVTGIVFYTGFAGCPARYYVTTVDPITGRQSTSVSNA